MKILVTGANGQLGTELKRVLEDKLPGITTYTDVDTLDLRDAQAVNLEMERGEYTHVVNCVAYTAVDRAEEEKAECAALNVDAVRNLATAADRTGAKVLHISTDYVFDGRSCRPYRESDKVNPISQYGTTKRKGETQLLAISPDSVIIRSAWLYSPYGRNFVKTILRLAEKASVHEPLRVVCDQVGTPTYALDLARAIVTILCSRQWVPGIFHFTNEGVASWYDFACAILRLRGIKAPIIPILTEDYPTAATRPFYSVLDRSCIKATYGVEILHWETSLAHCLQRM